METQPRFRPYDPNQLYLLPPDMRQWLPEDDLVYFLETGATPSGDYTGGLMAEVIDEGLSYLTDQDLHAIAHYILSLTPIDNAVKRRDKKRRGEFD